MIGQLQLLSTATTLTGATFSLAGQYDSIGTFLCCLHRTIDTSAPITYLTKVIRKSTLIDPGTGTIPADEEVFRDRFVLRRFWNSTTGKNWVQNRIAFTFPATYTYQWVNSGFQTLQQNIHYFNPFAKPSSIGTTGTSVHPADGPLATNLSTNPANRYAPDSSVPMVEPDPVYFVCDLKEGQSLQFINKCYVDDPFRDDATTPYLDNAIPTTTDVNGSEIETTFAGSLTAWILRI